MKASMVGLPRSTAGCSSFGGEVDKGSPLVEANPIAATTAQTRAHATRTFLGRRRLATAQLTPLASMGSYRKLLPWSRNPSTLAIAMWESGLPFGLELKKVKNKKNACIGRSRYIRDAAPKLSPRPSPTEVKAAQSLGAQACSGYAFTERSGVNQLVQGTRLPREVLPSREVSRKTLSYTIGARARRSSKARARRGTEREELMHHYSSTCITLLAAAGWLHALD